MAKAEFTTMALAEKETHDQASHGGGRRTGEKGISSDRHRIARGGKASVSDVVGWNDVRPVDRDGGEKGRRGRRRPGDTKKM
jgi:hypothetical protein